MIKFPIMAITSGLMLTIGSLISPMLTPVAQAAIKFKPPSKGAPIATRGGASRSAFKVLVPKENSGFTTQAQPTFVISIPPSIGGSKMKRTDKISICLTEQGAAPETSRFQATFAGPTAHGVIHLSLQDSGFAGLVEGKVYDWAIGVTADGQFDCVARNAKAGADGAIARIQPDATLQAKIASAKPPELPAVYAEAGIWYDAVQTLSDLRRDQPTNFRIQRDWESLLGSVELQSQAKTGYAACCQIQPRPISE
jgi:hypothetical protein